MFETTNQLLMVAYGTNQNSGSFHLEKTRICITQIPVGDHEMIVNWDVRITNWHEPLTQHNLRGILVLNLDELEFHSHKLIELTIEHCSETKPLKGNNIKFDNAARFVMYVLFVSED